MAHAATLNGLASSLVTAVTGKTKSEASFAGLHQQALKGLRDQSHARTNQFAVKSKLDGMVEKFEVLDREDLANAFQTRLDELPPKSRYMPEILSFLLELSDRPAEKTHLEHVKSANGPVFSEKELTWEDILAEDPLSGSEIWDDVERSYFSSGDDSFEEESEPTISTQATSDDEDVAAVARLNLIHPDDAQLSAVKETRESWKPSQSRDSSHILSELTVVREILSMMHGLPTDLFHLDASSGRVSLARRATMATASSHSLYDVLNGCVRTGTIVNYLRRWVARSQDIAYLQSIQSCVQKSCVQFGSQLAEIEQRFITSEMEIVVSAIQVQTEIERAAEVLTRLATMIRNASGDRSPFALLDCLYDETVISQVADSAETFQSLSSIFLAGLRTYLRPVASWTKTGSLTTKDNATFFVADSNFNCELGEFWHIHFSLRCLANGSPTAPKCFLPFAQKIFALGKSRALMKQLNQEPDDFSDGPAPVPSFEELTLQVQQNTMMPFTQLLHQALETWIAEVSTDCTPQLKLALLNDHGMLRTMTAVPYIYFSRDGIAFSALADALLAQVSRAESWKHDEFLLTELAQTIFSSIPGVDAENVSISTTLAEQTESKPLVSSTIRRLGSMEVKYHLPWPVQNITRSTTLDVHNKAFVFLLQVYSASTAIQSRFFDLRKREMEGCPAAFKLRQHLLCFTSLIQAYLATAANTIHEDMQARMQAAEDIDAMGAVWKSYEHRIETSLLLTQRLEPVREPIIRILELSEILSQTTGERSVAGLLEQYQKGMAFLVAGVRGVSRAGGDSNLEMLAERLEVMGEG